MKYPPDVVSDQTEAVNDLYISLSKQEKIKKAPEPASISASGSQNHFEIVAKVGVLDQSGKFQKLLTGDTTDYPSPSEADLAFCSFLTMAADSAETIDSIFRNSGLMREKWDEPHGDQTYGEATITKVLENPNKYHGGFVTKKTSQIEIVKELVTKVGRDNIIYHGKQFWVWEQERGLWVNAEDDVIKQLIHGTAHQDNITQSHVNSILELFKTQVYSATFYFNKKNRRVFNCLNGELHQENGEQILKPHDRKSYFIQQIPVAYDETAECPKFKTFLKQVFKDDSDRKEKIMLLQEFMGYALTTSCEYERFIIMVGNGSNGKSVVLAVITALLGTDNVAGVQPSQFEDRFALAHLTGKLANIITEIPQGAVIADAKLKALVSGERMTVQFKYGQLFDLDPYATMIFSANHLPHTKDFSNAFFRRAEILTFNRDFEKEEKDTTLKTELPKELQGIFNFALEGLKRLDRQGDFTQTQSSLDAKKEWEQEADQVAAFINEECERCATASISIAGLYDKYTQWVQDSGVKTAVAKRILTKRLVRLGYNRGKGGKGVHKILGIKLKSQ